MRRGLHSLSTEEYSQELWDRIGLYSYLTYVKSNTRIRISTFSKYRSVIALPIVFALMLIFIGRYETIIAPVIGISMLCLIPLSIYYFENNRGGRISNGSVFVVEKDLSFLRELILSILPYDAEECSAFEIRRNYTVEGLIFQKEDHTCRITLFCRDDNKTLVHFSGCDNGQIEHLIIFQNALDGIRDG